MRLHPNQPHGSVQCQRDATHAADGDQRMSVRLLTSFDRRLQHVSHLSGIAQTRGVDWDVGASDLVRTLGLRTKSDAPTSQSTPRVCAMPERCDTCCRRRSHLSFDQYPNAIPLRRQLFNTRTHIRRSGNDARKCQRDATHAADGDQRMSVRLFGHHCRNV
jgi:hypothetical protein